jgi:hypothetical protein
MKRCCACGQWYEPNRDKSSRCIHCKRKYNKEHYERNKQAYVARAAARKERVLTQLNELLAQYLAEHPCVDCGEDDMVVLEFDHIAEKNADVSMMLCKGYSWQAILREIRNCEVRCANCHRRVTAKRANWKRYRLNG